MSRLWGKIIVKNNIVQNHIIELNNNNSSFEEKLTKGIEELCYHFDIGIPLWLNDINSDMNQINKLKFKSQHFIEDIEFDYFEVEYLDDLAKHDFN